jgi:predicted HNH restriction endonuclease
MDAQDIRNLQEAYMEVCDEAYKKFPYKKVEDKIHKKEADNPTGRGTPQSVKMGKVFRHFKGEVRRTERRENSPKISKAKEAENRERETQKEQVDLYDIILSHLLDEGYAETSEAAEAIMVNMSEDWRDSIVEEVLEEAEGSYGQTPKATAAYIARAIGKGKSKTKSLASKHAVRSTADRYNSDKPYSHRSKMTQSDRDYHRGQSENHGGDREGIDYDEFDTGASGPGGKPKGKKLERQRKTGVSAD